MIYISFGGGTSGTGISPGLGASITFGWNTKKIVAEAHELVEEELGPTIMMHIKKCPFTKEFMPKGVKWEPSPLEAKPEPSWKGFSTKEH